MLHRSFKPAKCKTALKLAVSRIKLLNNKRQIQVKQMKRELAQLLESGQVQTARIRVEHVIREEKTLTAYNLIEIYCELIAARLSIIESQKTCPIDLKEAISSVIFASPRCADLPELMDIKKHLTAKYGKEFVTVAIELRPDCGVNRMLVEKLSAKAPDGQTKLKILTVIAEEHNVKWDPDLFSGNDSTPPQDLLNGPSTFESANKIHSEAPPDPIRPIPDDKGAPNVQAPPRHDEKQDVHENFNEYNRRTSTGSQNVSSTGVTIDKATTSSTFHPELRSSGSGTEHMEYKQSYPGNENAGGHNWNVEFKDATSAAQAAAESAELASRAARAAAELSRQHSSESQKSSGHFLKDERPQLYVHSKLQSDHVPKDAENNVFQGRTSGIRDEHIVDKEREERGGAAERFVRDGYRNNDPYNKASSLKSSPTSIDDVRSVNNTQAADRYSRRKSSEYDNIEFLDDKQSSDSDLKSVAKKPDSVKSEETAYFDEKLTRKQSSGISRHSHQSSFSDDQEDILRKNDNVYDEDTKTGKKSSRASSRSHSSNASYGHEDIFKRNDFAEDHFVYDDRNAYRNPSEINSNEYTTVFDDYGSDDNDILDVRNYREQQTSLNFSSPRKESSIDLLFNSTVWSPRRNADERPGRSTTQSRQSVFSEVPEGSGLPSRPADMPAFDDYDSPGSESEVILESKLTGSSDLHKFPSEKNVHSRSSEPVQSEEHISVGSSSSEDGNVGSRRNSWLPTSTVNLQPNEGHSDRRQGIKSSPISEEKFDYGEPASDQLASRPMKSGLDSAVKDTPESWDTMKETELLKESTAVSAKELNFGTLTGGLRNRGNRRPPYMRKPIENSVSQAIEDTSTENDRTSPSTVRSSIGPSAGYQEPYAEKSSTRQDKKASMASFSKHVDSDDDQLAEERGRETSISRQPYKLVEEHQQETSISKQLYDQKLGSELNKKSTSRATRTYFDSDNSDSDEDRPKMSSPSNARLGAGLSRRTKVSPSNSARTHSRTTVSSLNSRNPNHKAESKSSSSRPNVSETVPKPRLETKWSHHTGSPQQHGLVEQDTRKPIPEPRRSSRLESSKSSTREQASSSVPKVATSGVTGASNVPVVSGETSSKDTSHVHPKLPDSDAFTAFFQSLKQTRE